MRKTGPDKKTVALVLARADSVCERCGRGQVEQIHHRKPRGAGGSSDPAINSPANLLALCSKCHLEVERDRSVSYEQGWLVRRDHDPAGSRVWLAGVGYSFLINDGSIEQAAA